jgi:hypothetical protein
MKKHSCGAILYTIYDNKIYIVLGMEKGQWFPFKGGKEKDETNEIAAIREIYEETCGVIKLKNITLKCHYSTKRKHYHIGLIKIPLNTIEKFSINRKYILNNLKLKNCHNNYDAYLEKSDIKMFSLESIFSNNFHEVTIKPIKYYYTYLKSIENKLSNTQLNNSNWDELFKYSPYLTSVSTKFSIKIIQNIQSHLSQEFMSAIHI